MPSLYANTVSSNAVIQPNNNTSLYNPLGGPVIPVNGNINANNVNVSNNVQCGRPNQCTGNITTAGFFIGNGSQLTGLPASYSNANVAAFLPTYTGNLSGAGLGLTGAAVVTGNITTGGFYFGDGSQLTGITTDYSNANVAAFLPTYSGNISAGNIAVVNSITGANITASAQISATGDISTQGNLRTLGAQGNIVGPNYVSANFFVGDGSLLTNVVATGNYSNSNVTSLLAAFGSNTISTTGNITSGYLFGNGSQLTGIAASYGNANVATFLANFGSNTIVTSGNITGGNIVGNGQSLTNLPGANVTGQVANALVAGTVYTAAQPNITSVGTLTVVNTTGNVSATGNITGGNLAIGNNTNIGGNLSVVGTIFGTFAGNISGNLVVPGSNTDVLFNNSGNAGASTNFRFDSATNIMTVNGTANVGSLNSTGNVSGANIIASANAVVGGINTDNYRYANGVPVSFDGTYGNANVADFLDSFGSNAIVTTGNITGGNFIGNGQSLTNLTGANVVGAVANATFATTAATANTANSVAGANVTGTVANATQADTANVANSVAGGNVTGQVANALVAGTVYTNAQPNITSVGTLSSLNVSANAAGAFAASVYNINPTGAGLDVRSGDGSGTNTMFVVRDTNLGNTRLIIQEKGATTVTNDTISLVGNVIASGPISTTGNVTGGNLNTAGNVSGSYILGDGSQLTNLPVQPGTYGNANVNAHLAAFGSNTIVTTGNITGGNIVGNGQSLSNLTGANVTGTVANATFATSAGTATTATTADQANYANIANSVSGGNVSGQVANALVAGTVYVNAQPNITSVGTLTSLSVSGNISGGNVNTNAVQATGSGGLALKNSAGTTQASLGAGGGDNFAINVSTNLNGNNAQIDISPTGTGHVHIKPTGTGAVEIAPTSTGSVNNMVIGNATPRAANVTTLGTTGNITAAGILTDNYRYANGTPVSFAGTYGDANVNSLLSAWGSNALSTTGNVTSGNINTSFVNFGAGKGNVDASTLFLGDTTGVYQNMVRLVNNQNIGYLQIGSGNTSGLFRVSKWLSANTAMEIDTDTNRVGINKNSPTVELDVAGAIVATGNISGNYFVGNGSALTGITTSAGGSNTQLQFNNGGVFAGNVAMTFNTTTGNVTLGNVVINGNAIQVTGSFQSNANPNPGRVLFGNGVAGNYNPTINTTSSRILQVDEIFKYDDGLRTGGITATLYGNLSQGNIGAANSNSRLQAAQSELYVVSGNSLTTNTFAIRGYNAALNVGGPTANVGNAFVNAGAGGTSFITVFAGSTANTMITNLSGATYNGNVTNAVGFMTYFSGSASVTGNVYGYYMPGTTSFGGQSQGNIARGATNYYFLRTDDNLAKSRLGSLELYQNFTANATATGSVTINKNSGQYQNMYLSGNVTSMAFSNFVTRVQTPSGTFNNQSDVVTLVIQQGVTPYTVTMPTGNAQIRYANGNSTVPSVANSTVIMTVTGTYNYNTSADNYLINISPVYT
jgi:hypothetical protein